VREPGGCTGLWGREAATGQAPQPRILDPFTPGQQETETLLVGGEKNEDEGDIRYWLPALRYDYRACRGLVLLDNGGRAFRQPLEFSLLCLVSAEEECPDVRWSLVMIAGQRGHLLDSTVSRVYRRGSEVKRREGAESLAGFLTTNENSVVFTPLLSRSGNWLT